MDQSSVVIEQSYRMQLFSFCDPFTHQQEKV